MHVLFILMFVYIYIDCKPLGSTETIDVYIAMLRELGELVSTCFGQLQLAQKAVVCTVTKGHHYLQTLVH